MVEDNNSGVLLTPTATVVNLTRSTRITYHKRFQHFLQVRDILQNTSIALGRDGEASLQRAGADGTGRRLFVRTS